MKKLLVIILCVLITVTILGCKQNPPAQVVATTQPLYDFTSYLCNGTSITVAPLITDNISCLHDYTLQVNQMKMLEQAEIMIINGSGLEPFLEDIPLPGKVTIDASHLISHSQDTKNASHTHTEHGHEHEADPHIWLSPICAKQMVDAICEGLKEAYPDYEDTFEQNRIQLNGQLDVLLNYGMESLETLSCRELITFHDGFSYFADAFQLEILKALEEESGSEASANDLKELADLIDRHNLPAVFTERNGSVSAAEIISRETGAQVYSLDMAMSGIRYFDAMYHNINTIKEALG